MQLDKDTQKVMLEGQEIDNFTKSDAWNLVKEKLTSRLAAMDSLSTMDFTNKTETQIALEVQTRANTVMTIRQWIEEVEGTAEQFRVNKEMLLSHTEESLIINY